jgi:hypothetical protein
MGMVWHGFLRKIQMVIVISLAMVQHQTKPLSIHITLPKWLMASGGSVHDHNLIACPESPNILLVSTQNS